MSARSQADEDRDWVDLAQGNDVWDMTYSSDTESYSPSGSSSSGDDPVLDHSNDAVVVVSDGEDDLEIQQVRKLSAEEIRRQRMDAARAALRRAANAAPRPPPPTNALLSTYKCSICLCPPTNVSVTSCGHMFCGGCLYDALSMQMRQDGHEWSDTDWLGVMGDPAARNAPRGSNLFTPFGSSGALALANAAGISSSPAREIFSEWVSQRQAGGSPDEAPSEHAPPAVPASRLRANNGTGRLRGHCPVCRTTIQGGFTGPGRRGILGLDIMLGTPAAEPQPFDAPVDDPSSDHETTQEPRKRARAQ